MRIRPFQFQDGVHLLDIQQVIPLPQAADYQERVKEKTQKEKADRSERDVLRMQFWRGLLERARRRTQLHANIPAGIDGWIGTSAHLPPGLSLNYVIQPYGGRAELYINNTSQAENTRIFKALEAKRDEIDNAFKTSATGMESGFGGELEWDPKEGKQHALICAETDKGGYRSERREWPVIQDERIDAMIRLEKAMRSHLDAAVSSKA